MKTSEHTPGGIIAAESFTMPELQVLKRKKGNPGGKKVKYMDIVTAFDIETTSFFPEKQAAMYIWQWQWGDLFTIIGRTWDEFLEVCDRITLPDNCRLVVFDHNLSYEFQFLRGIYSFSEEEVFAVDPRRILKCTMFHKLEFRCSYLHCNMSLSEFLKKNHAEHQKLSGDDFGYEKERYPWTELTSAELEYCVNDVRGLVEAINNEMEADGDNLYSLPLTSTGYVRRDAKRAMAQIDHLYSKRQAPTYHLYCMLREAFRGGNTHANRFYSGRILQNVKSADRSSSYPDVIVNDTFPVRPFYEATGKKFSLDQVLDLINRRGKAVVMRVALWDVELARDWWGCPYLAHEKCRNIGRGVYDNGRVLRASYLETTITDIDLLILLDEYKFSAFIAFDVAYAAYGKLPKVFTDTVIDYYRKKTELKGVAGQENLYNKSKAKLNSLYGMMAQDPVKQTIAFIDDDFELKPEDARELLAAANNKCFLVYQWGVWTTAWARYRLEEGIRLAGDNFVYCDTDSVKYLEDLDWTGYNRIRKEASEKTGAHATDPHGEEHYMGVYEADGQYDEFATLGAKKYVYTHDGKLEVTIAGVNKKKGAAELVKHGGIIAFKPGFVFTEGGGTESVYNDHPEIREVKREGRSIPITANLVIMPSMYTLGITREYEFLLRDPKLLGRVGLEL